MTRTLDDTGGRRGMNWRVVGWGMAAFVLLLPFLAMQVTREVDWNATDFIIIGAMLAIAGGTIELGARMSRNWSYRGGVGVAVATTFLLIWVNLAVGFLGSERNPANLIFFGVFAVGIAGAFIVGFRPAGMAKAMVATAAAQVFVGVVALAAGLGSTGYDGVYEVMMGSILFAGMWLASAWLFRRADRQISAVPSVSVG